MYLPEKKPVIYAFLMVFISTFFAIKTLYAQIILDRDMINIYSGLERLLGGPVQEERLKEVTLPSGKTVSLEGETSFRILKVTNISGNNPFHQTQPVFNFGGVQVASVSELLDCLQMGKCKTQAPGGGGGGGGDGVCCNPNMETMFRTSNSVPAGMFFNVIYIFTPGSDPGGSYAKCEWHASGIHGLNMASFSSTTYIGFFATSDPDGTPKPNDYAYVGTKTTYFDVIQPPAGSAPASIYGLSVYRLKWGTYSMTVQDKKTKQKFRIDFKISAVYRNIGGGSEGLDSQTLSITQVNCQP